MTVLQDGVRFNSSVLDSGVDYTEYLIRKFQERLQFFCFRFGGVDVRPVASSTGNATASILLF